eukprot:jgi/Chrzof1/11820/Cz06g11060.t1
MHHWLQLRNELDFKQAINEVTAAVDHLRSSGSKKVGVVGFCMGGALAFCAAQHSGVDAAVPFYGTPDPAVCQPESIKVPVQAHFGKLDSMQGISDPETVAPLMEKIKAAGVNLEYYSYDSAGHGFMNALLGDMGIAKIEEVGQPVPNEEDPKTAFDRMTAFFKKHLAETTTL